MINDRPKSRRLLFSEYFSTMQQEFIVSFLRFRINKKYNYQKKYIDICEFKKKEILKLAFRNNNVTIFDDIKRWDKYVNQIVEDGFGLPNFIYKDERQKEHLSIWDLYYYFHKGTKVTIEDKEGIVIRNNTYNKKLIVLIDGNTKEYAYSQAKSDSANSLKVSNKQLQLMKNNVLASLFLNQS